MTDIVKLNSLLQENNISEVDIVNFLKEKKNNVKPEYNTCSICLEKAILPVQINGIPQDKNIEIVGKRNNLCFLRPCPNSKNNMVCLPCWRNYMKVKSKNKDTNITCLTRCCSIQTKGCLSYGEIGRSVNDLAMPDLWKKMDKCLDCGKDNNPLYFRSCPNNCGFVGENVLDLANHYRSKCENREITCILCSKKVLFKNLEKHKQEECFLKCKSCNCNLKYDIEYKKNKPTISVKEDHFCSEVKCFLCTVCNKNFSLSNISEHINCSNIKKQNSKNHTYHSKEKIITRPNHTDNDYINNLEELDKIQLKENSEKLINILKNIINKIDI